MEKIDDVNNARNHQQRERNLINRIKQFVSDNLGKNLTASAVAKQFEMSVSSLEHLFKVYQGQTYHQYVVDTRMTTAFDLITKDGMRVQQAMYATGYHYRSSFNKAFNKSFKHPPGYYRNKSE